MNEAAELRSELAQAEAKVKALELQLQELQKGLARDKTHMDDLRQILRERDDAVRLLSEEQKKADGLLAHLGALRAVLILDGGDKLAPEIRKALWLDHDVALDLQRVRREVVEAARALDQQYVKWADMGLNGLRMQEALTALAAVELARTEKGLPLETRIIEKRIDVADAVRKFSNTCSTHSVTDCRTCGLDK